MFYSKANLKINGNQDSPFIKPFQMGTMSDNRLPTRTLQPIHSHVYNFHQLDQNTRHNVNVINDLSPKWIVSFLEVYKSD
jgi:hypothetical protein